MNIQFLGWSTPGSNGAIYQDVVDSDTNQHLYRMTGNVVEGWQQNESEVWDYLYNLGLL